MTINIGRKIEYKWFTYSDGHGSVLHETKEEAIKYTNEMIEDFRDVDGWDDAVESVCMGKIIAYAKLEKELSDDQIFPNWDRYKMRECQ